MVVRRSSYISIAVLIISIIGIAAILLTRSAGRKGLSAEDDRFADVFIEMALAREMAGNDLDSLDILYSGIFERYDVDSIWLYDYISTISYDAERHKQIWDVIIERLDSLKRNPETDSS
ncbi:MAG: hypothetical protein JSW64_11930 [Candidatus Zixiibacteriota bacterium]|nr:MAG: hypothetical protein JSW64_11930 [candidate division Zixibacteria bacterium]